MDFYVHANSVELRVYRESDSVLLYSFATKNLRLTTFDHYVAMAIIIPLLGMK